MEEEVRQILRNAVREEAGIPDPLEVLRDEFDSLVARMQTPKAKDAGTALFARSGPKQT
jgi:plasmid stability protein